MIINGPLSAPLVQRPQGQGNASKGCISRPFSTIFPRPLSNRGPFQPIPSLDSLNQRIDRFVLELGRESLDSELSLYMLERIWTKHKIVDAVGKVEKFGFKQLNAPSKVVKDGIKFLESTIPEQIFAKHPFFEKQLTDTAYIFDLGQALLKAFDSGFNLSAIGYRSQLLEEANSLIKKISKKYEARGEALPENLVKWKKKVVAEKEALQEKSYEVSLKTTKNIPSWAKSAFKFFKWDSKAFKNVVFLKSLGAFSSGLSLTMNWQNWKASQQEAIKYAQLSKIYVTYEERIRPQITVVDRRLALARLRLPIVPLRPIKPLAELAKRVQVSPDHEGELDYFFRHCSSIDEINSALDCYGQFSYWHFSNRAELLERWEKNPGFKIRILSGYRQFKEEWARLEYLSQTVHHVLQKREVMVKQKIIALRPRFEELVPKLQKIFKTSFQRKLSVALEMALKPETGREEVKAKFYALGIDLPEATQAELTEYLTQVKRSPEEQEILFKQWFFNQSEDDLLKAYIDYQETLEQVIKDGLQNIISQKYQIEAKFFKFNQFSSVLDIAIGIVSFIGSLSCLFLAISPAVLLTVFGSYLTTLASLTTYLSSVSLAVSYLLTFLYKRSTLAPVHYLEKMIFLVKKIQLTRAEHAQKCNKLKLRESIKVIFDLKSAAGPLNHQQFDKAMEIYKKAWEKSKAGLTQVEQRFQELKKLEKRIIGRTWKDFSLYANLISSESPDKFDTLRSLQEALEECDPALISRASKKFITLQLAFEFEELEENQALSPLINALQNFLALGDSKLLSSMEDREGLL